MARGIRRAGRWAGTVAVAILLALYAVSLRWYVARFYSPFVAIGLDQGAIGVGWASGAPVGKGPPPGWQFGHRVLPFMWLPASYPTPGGVILAVPIWIPLAGVGVPTAWLWRRDRRADPRNLPGHCRSCGYSLAGLPAGQPCPECGSRA